MSKPTNLEECFTELDKIFSDEEKEKIKKSNKDGMIRYHHGMGTWIRNNWGLWSGSRLKMTFELLGIWHTDDMSGIILDSYRHRLRGEPLDIEAQVEHYIQFWRKNESR